MALKWAALTAGLLLCKQDIFAQTNPVGKRSASSQKKVKSRSPARIRVFSPRARLPNGRRRGSRPKKEEKPFLKDIANRRLRTRQYSPDNRDAPNYPRVARPRTSPDRPAPKKRSASVRRRTDRSTQSEGGSLNGGGNRPLRSSRYRPGDSDKSNYAQASKPRARKDRAKPKKWSTGWHSKWNRGRIARAARTDEQPWKGDISGRNMSRSFKEPKTLDGKRPMKLRKKSPVGTQGTPPNKLYTPAMEDYRRNARSVAGFSGQTRRPAMKRNPNSHPDASAARAPRKGMENVASFSGQTRRPAMKRNPNSHPNAPAARPPRRGTEKIASFSGQTRRPAMKRNPNSHPDARAARAPQRGLKKVTQFAGHTRIRSFTDPRLHPDAVFAHGFLENAQGKQTLLTDLKLIWAKVFRKADLQPPHLKKRIKKPHYDNGEKGLWYR